MVPESDSFQYAEVIENLVESVRWLLSFSECPLLFHFAEIDRVQFVDKVAD